MTNPTDERAAFEAWADSFSERLRSGTTGDFDYPLGRMLWEAWSARASLAGQAAAPEGAAVAWMPKSYHDMTLQELQREQGALNAAVYAKLGGAGGITVSCATAPTTQEPK